MMKKWMEEHWYDFEGQSELLEQVKNFIEIISKSGMDQAATTLSKIIYKKVKFIRICHKKNCREIFFFINLKIETYHFF